MGTSGEIAVSSSIAEEQRVNEPACGGVVGVIAGSSPSTIEMMASRLRHRGDLRVASDRTAVAFFGALGPSTSQCIHANEHGVVCADLGWVDSATLAGGAGTGEPVSTQDWANGLQALFRTQGLSAIQNLNGEFALAIYEADSRSLILARDYSGSKPLHYCLPVAGAFAFASEYKAILALRGIDREVDRAMLQLVQATKALPLGRTLFSNIFALPPGVAIRVSCSGEVLERYRMPAPVAEARVVDSDSAVNLIRAQLLEGLEHCVGNASEIGIALSGGIDSVGIAFALRQQYPDRSIHAFTAAYGPEDAELVVATQVASEIGAHHHTVLTLPEALGRHLPSVIWHQEGPFSRSETLQLYLIGEAARQHVSVLLSGQAADMLFAGMPRHRLLHWIKRFSPFAAQLQEFYEFTQTGLEPRTLGGRLLKNVKYRGRITSVPHILGVETEPHRMSWPELSENFIDEVLAVNSQQGISQSENKFERAFAAFGVGHRSPFCEQKFMHLAFAIDERLKIQRNVQKLVLRRAFSGIVPDQYLYAPKHPQRMKYDQAFADELDRLSRRFLAPEAIRKRGFFAVDEIERLFAVRRRSGYFDEAAMRIWTVLATEMWALLFLDGSSPDDLAGRI